MDDLGWNLHTLIVLGIIALGLYVLSEVVGALIILYIKFIKRY
jgi:hypothetical protein